MLDFLLGEFCSRSSRAKVYNIFRYPRLHLSYTMDVLYPEGLKCVLLCYRQYRSCTLTSCLHRFKRILNQSMIQQAQFIITITILLLCLFVVFFVCFFDEESCLDSSAELCSAANWQNPCSCKNRCATRKCPCKLNRIPCGSVGRTCSNKPSVKPDPEEAVNVDDRR